MTLDNALHTLLGFCFGAVVYLLSVKYPLIGAWAAGSMFLFFRELTQIQSNNQGHEDDFRYGWGRNFDPARNHLREWLYPSIALAVVAGLSSAFL
jgi:hypothetical protein